MGFTQQSPSILCPRCKGESIVKRSYGSRTGDHVIRHRHCKSCPFKFMTREYYEDIGLAEMRATLNKMYEKLDEMTKLFNAATRKIERA